MWKRWVIASVAVLFMVVGIRADELGVGDAAPKLELKEFVKGEPVEKFEKGKTYVVEFWATWCGPCRTSIPHLTELQKKHKDVVFIGVSVWEDKPEGVKPFVEEMGEKMNYRVALDATPAGEPKGMMAKTWLTAAGEDGIPSTFIVDKNGHVAWIGHPMSMDKPLDQIVSGKWDLVAATSEHKKVQEGRRKLRELQEVIAAARQSGDPTEALEAIDKAIAEDKTLEDQLAFTKFSLLAGKGGNTAKAVECGNKLLDTTLKSNEEGLNMLAWMIVDPDRAQKADKPLLEFALNVAKKADELAKGKKGHIADTLALVYFENGDAAKALETQERAMEHIKGTSFEKDPSLKERLEKYKKAVNK
jgi:thiol-disulfide isomerase/thioredoxin